MINSVFDENSTESALSRSLDSIIRENKTKQHNLKLSQRRANAGKRKVGGLRQRQQSKNRLMNGYGIKAKKSGSLRASTKQLSRRRAANQRKFANLRRALNISNQRQQKKPLIISTGSTVSLSGFDHSVTSDQIRVRYVLKRKLKFIKIKDIFGKNFPVKSATVQYDENGNSLGTAEIVFQNRTIALNACKKFDMAFVDNREIRMRMIEFKKFSQTSNASNIQTTENVGLPRRKRMRNLRQKLIKKNRSSQFVNPLLRDVNDSGSGRISNRRFGGKSSVFGTALRSKRGGGRFRQQRTGRGRFINQSLNGINSKAGIASMADTEAEKQKELNMLDAELDSYHTN